MLKELKNGFGMERMPCGQTEAKEIRRRIFELSLVLDGEEYYCNYYCNYERDENRRGGMPRKGKNDIDTTQYFIAEEIVGLI